MSHQSIRGDLLKLALDGRFDVILHGCNCQCVMGAGIAKQVRTLFPEAFEADLETRKGAREKLGTISWAAIARPSARFVIVNAYTQFHWRGGGVKVEYDAVRSAMKSVKSRFAGLRIGYPQIRAGMAGGDWEVISRIISEELAGERHSLVVYDPTAAQ